MNQEGKSGNTRKKRTKEERDEEADGKGRGKGRGNSKKAKVEVEDPKIVTLDEMFGRKIVKKRESDTEAKAGRDTSDTPPLKPQKVDPQHSELVMSLSDDESCTPSSSGSNYTTISSPPPKQETIVISSSDSTTHATETVACPVCGKLGFTAETVNVHLDLCLWEMGGGS